MTKIAILDDYQNVATTMADWSRVSDRADLVVFTDHVSDPDDVVAQLADFDAICVMRERTPLSRSIIEQLPRLKLIASTGPGNASIDVAAAQERGIQITNTGYTATPTVELTWAMIMASARNLTGENASVRAGGWQTTVGRELRGRVLGILGLGRIGTQIARIGTAFGMEVLAWSQHLTPEAAQAAGAIPVSKDALLSQSDVVTIHLVLSDRTRGLIGTDELARMKTTSWLVNTSRGPIVDEAALVDALSAGAIGGAALDVFDTEPLPPDHPLRTLPNVLATPHIGYVAEDLYRTFYRDAAAAVNDWLDDVVTSTDGAQP